MNKAKKAMISSGAALLGAGYMIGKRRSENNKNAYQKILDRVEKALD